MKMKKLDEFEDEKVDEDDGYLVMKIIQSCKLFCDESILTMKVIIVKEVMTCDDVCKNFPSLTFLFFEMMPSALIVTCKCPKSMSSQKMSPLGTCT